MLPVAIAGPLLPLPGGEEDDRPSDRGTVSAKTVSLFRSLVLSLTVLLIKEHNKASLFSHSVTGPPNSVEMQCARGPRQLQTPLGVGRWFFPEPT